VQCQRTNNSYNKSCIDTCEYLAVNLDKLQHLSGEVLQH
jgi:hypothetical protein